jgi:hypothetical protein
MVCGTINWAGGFGACLEFSDAQHSVQNLTVTGLTGETLNSAFTKFAVRAPISPFIFRKKIQKKNTPKGKERKESRRR